MADASVRRSKRLKDSRQPITSPQKALALLSGLIPGRKSKRTITSSDVPTNLPPTSTNTQINDDPPFEDIDPTRDQLDTPSSRDTTNNAIDSKEHISTVSGAQDLGSSPPRPRSTRRREVIYFTCTLPDELYIVLLISKRSDQLHMWGSI